MTAEKWTTTESEFFKKTAEYQQMLIDELQSKITALENVLESYKNMDELRSRMYSDMSKQRDEAFGQAQSLVEDLKQTWRDQIEVENQIKDVIAYCNDAAFVAVERKLQSILSGEYEWYNPQN